MDQPDLRDPSKEDPASFRDPSSVVLVGEDRVIRGFVEEGLADFNALSKTRFYRRAMEDGRIVSTEPADATVEGLAGRFAGIVKHSQIPFISYPYEWTFHMLKDAALLSLELLTSSLEEGLTMKDATPYNVQFVGCSPTFIDVGSFERRREEEPWYGYLQFCQMFLYPLMLQAHRQVPFQPWLRSNLEGITPQEARRMMSIFDYFRKGVFKHAYLHSRLQGAYSSNRRTQEVQSELKQAGFRSELIKSNVAGLAKLIHGLTWKTQQSEWSEYESAAQRAPVNTRAKQAFIEHVLAARSRRLVLDLGANDGRFSFIAARHADLVLAVDSDQLVVDRLYRRLRESRQSRILPLLQDIANPSPGIGWRGKERPGFFERARPDVILMLALVHHLAISRHLPLRHIVCWLAGLGAELVIEFPTPDDPQVQKLLLSKRQGAHPSYRLDEFESALNDRFEVLSRQILPSSTRFLYHAQPRSS